MVARATTWEAASRGAWSLAGLTLRPLHLGVAFPSILYVATLAASLFRPPSLDLPQIDRIAFLLLFFFVVLRTLATRDRIPYVPLITLPMLGLTALAVVRAQRDPFDAQTWSLVAGKFVVPFILFHLALLVFRDAREQKHFAIFVIVVLAYLSLTAVAFLLDARSLVYPKFILDESLGVHAHRARGPFLQAVANGVSLNMLGILVLVLAPKHRKIVLLLWLALPLAILATMTRAVWISFAASTVVLAFRLGDRCLRRASVAATLVGLFALLAIAVGGSSFASAVRDRTEERGPVEARLAVYEAGWQMVQEHPLSGWTAGTMYAELAQRMQGYRLRQYYIHNTYLSMLLEFGLPGLLLYGILLVGLFRLARAGDGDGISRRGAVSNLRRVWPILLGVYLFNACFVDMVYQFVNGLLFTAAGILCAARETTS